MSCDVVRRQLGSSAARPAAGRNWVSAGYTNEREANQFASNVNLLATLLNVSPGDLVAELSGEAECFLSREHKRAVAVSS